MTCVAGEAAEGVTPSPRGSVCTCVSVKCVCYPPRSAAHHQAAAAAARGAVPEPGVTRGAWRSRAAGQVGTGAAACGRPWLGDADRQHPRAAR